MLARTACARHQPIPLEHAKQGALPPPPLYRATGTDKSPARNSPRAKPHPPPAKGSGHIQGAHGKPPAGQCTHVETTDDGVGHDVWPTNARETVTRPAPIVARVQSRCRKQPRLQPLDSQSGSNRADQRCKHDARPSCSDRCKHDSKSPPPAPNSRDARMSSAVSRRTIHTPGFPSSERPHVAPMASTMEWVPPWSQAWRPPATHSSTKSG